MLLHSHLSPPLFPMMGRTAAAASAPRIEGCKRVGFQAGVEARAPGQGLDDACQGRGLLSRLWRILLVLSCSTSITCTRSQVVMGLLCISLQPTRAEALVLGHGLLDACQSPGLACSKDRSLTVLCCSNCSTVVSSIRSLFIRWAVCSAAGQNVHISRQYSALSSRPAQTQAVRARAELLCLRCATMNRRKLLHHSLPLLRKIHLLWPAALVPGPTPLSGRSWRRQLASPSPSGPPARPRPLPARSAPSIVSLRMHPG